MTGGGVVKSVVLDAKSETRRVADMMIRRSGCSIAMKRKKIKFIVIDDYTTTLNVWIYITHFNSFFLLLPHLLPEPNDSTQHSNQNISIHTPLMRLVDNDHRILVQ